MKKIILILTLSYTLNSLAVKDHDHDVSYNQDHIVHKNRGPKEVIKHQKNKKQDSKGHHDHEDHNHDEHDADKHDHNIHDDKNHDKEAVHTDSYAAHHDDHDHDHETNSQVGADKGILEANEQDGFKLSPEAEKNFEITKQTISKEGLLEVPPKAIVTTGSELNMYRFRDGFYKRIDCRILKSNSEKSKVQISDFKNGDEIVLTGTGFLRLAEIAAFGGAPDGHAH